MDGFTRYFRTVEPFQKNWDIPCPGSWYRCGELSALHPEMSGTPAGYYQLQDESICQGVVKSRHLPQDVGEVCNISLSSLPKIPGVFPVGFRAEDPADKGKSPQE